MMRLHSLIALTIPVLLSCGIGFTSEPLATADLQTDDIGRRVNTSISNGVAITKGTIRVRRRHENDMDFSKYNPFYWEGRATHFSVEDFTPNGEQKIRFRLHTEWPQDYTIYRGADLSAIYIGDPLKDETLRSKFAINVRMKHTGDFRNFEYVLDENAFRNRTELLAQGKQLTFEFRFFNNVDHPGWAIQKERNAHNLSAYYSEFLRIRIGEPGLLIDRFGSENELATPAQYAGGWTTTPTVRVEPWMGLQQQALNLSPARATDFLVGRSWFHTDFVTGKHRSDPSDDKPSRFFESMELERKDFAASAYNRTSCNQCHHHNGMSLLPAIGEAIHDTVARTVTLDTGAPHPRLGHQLQTDGEDAEGRLELISYASNSVSLAGSEPVILKRPVFAIRNGGDPVSDVALSVRKTPALVGIGLLDAVPAATLLSFAAANGGTVGPGRFGWKANQPSLRAQIQDALLHDMGVRSAGVENVDTADATPGKGLLPETAIDELEAYVALLGVPPRINPEDPEVRRGEAVFNQLKCNQCHIPTMTTGASRFSELERQVIHPYTDLLLHDMGEGLADPDGGPQARLWRTAPLWGLKNVRHANDDFMGTFNPGDIHVTYEETHAAADKNRLELLHDGRASTIAEAILWHGGAAASSAKAYQGLTPADRAALESFLFDL